jgi:transcriptional regulator with XRE-family HTH domain
MSTELTTFTPAAEAANLPAVDRRAYLESLPSKELQRATESLGSAAEDARQVRDERIHARAADGLTQGAIAAEFGLTRARVSQLLNDKTGNESKRNAPIPSDLPSIRDEVLALRESLAADRQRLTQLQAAEMPALRVAEVEWAEANDRPTPRATGYLEAEPEVVDAEPVFEPELPDTGPHHGGGRTAGSRDTMPAGDVVHVAQQVELNLRSFETQVKADIIIPQRLEASVAALDALIKQAASLKYLLLSLRATDEDGE